MSKRLDQERMKFLDETATAYEAALMENQAALSYLRGRGLSMDSIRRFRLGFAADPPAEHARMAGRLVIPYSKRVGVVGFKFRCIDRSCLDNPDGESHRGHAKYVNYDPLMLFNVGAVDNDRDLIALAEGEFDAMILDGECDIPAVGFPSAQSWSANPHWRRLLKDFSRVFMFADPDEPGQTLARQVREAIPQTVIVNLPDVGQKADVTNVFLAKGRDLLRSQVGLAA